MGSFSAAGGIKSGEKMVTAVEAPDTATALFLAGFKSFAKPGGSDFAVNARIDDDPDLRSRWCQANVRFGTFTIRTGDAYYVPESALHEFMNHTACLSVAWNLLPPPSNCQDAWRMAAESIEEAKWYLSSTPNRLRGVVEHAPKHLLDSRYQEW
ncbi:unnamed protein product, partial [Choristocarpus tenellus]